VDAAGRVVVEVRDTGSGIPRELLHRIFDPFFTTKPVGVGTGLGLAISHRIVNALGGEITVDSTPGAGTTFRVTLAPSDELPAPSLKPHPSVALRRGNVLVVDDESIVLKAVYRILHAEHDVVGVHSAE